nr:MAG: capsid protein [Cressdnaviricota sp.]
MDYEDRKHNGMDNYFGQRRAHSRSSWAAAPTTRRPRGFRSAPWAGAGRYKVKAGRGSTRGKGSKGLRGRGRRVAGRSGGGKRGSRAKHGVGRRKSFKSSKLASGFAAVPPIIMADVGGERVTCGLSQQTYTTLRSALGWGSDSDISTIAQSAITNGANAITSLAVGSTVKVAISFYVVGTFVNTHSAPIHATFYFIKPRGKLDNITSIVGPQLAVTQGMTDEAAGTAPFGSTFPTSKPQDSQLFNQNYRIKKSVHKEIAPGESYHYMLKGKTKVFDCATLSRYSTIYYSSYPSWMWFVMVRLIGAPCNDVTTVTSVTTGACTADHFWRGAFTARCVSKTGKVLQILRDARGSVTTESVMNEDTAAPAAAANA